MKHKNFIIVLFSLFCFFINPHFQALNANENVQEIHNSQDFTLEISLDEWAIEKAFSHASEDEINAFVGVIQLTKTDGMGIVFLGHVRPIQTKTKRPDYKLMIMEDYLVYMSYQFFEGVNRHAQAGIEGYYEVRQIDRNWHRGFINETGICTHELYGKGLWRIKRAVRLESGYTFLLSVYFPKNHSEEQNKIDAEAFFQVSENMLKEKKKP